MLADLIRGGVMDWKLAMEEERAALKRLVALLFALADLAEIAAGRSRLVRRFVIWILRRAEIVARDYIIGDVDAPPALMPVGLVHDDLADAMRLARGFRELARELDRQVRLAFAVQDGIYDRVEQTAWAGSDVRRMRRADDFLNALRQAAAQIARRAACATGPPGMP